MKLVCLRCKTVFILEGKVGISKVIRDYKCPRCDTTLTNYKSKIAKRREAWRYHWRKVYVGYKYITVLDPNTLYLKTTQTSYWSFPKLDKGVGHGKKRSRIKISEFSHSLQIRIKALYHFDLAKEKREVDTKKNKRYISKHTYNRR